MFVESSTPLISPALLTRECRSVRMATDAMTGRNRGFQLVFFHLCRFEGFVTWSSRALSKLPYILPLLFTMHCSSRLPCNLTGLNFWGGYFLLCTHQKKDFSGKSLSRGRALEHEITITLFFNKTTTSLFANSGLPILSSKQLGVLRVLLLGVWLAQS